MPESAIDDQEDIPLLLLPAPPFPFLSFSLNSVPGDATCVDIPRSEVNVCADLELPVGDPSKIRPYSSLTGLLLSLFSLTAFSFRKPKNKRKAE